MPYCSSVNRRSSHYFFRWLTLINRTSKGFLDFAIGIKSAQEPDWMRRQRRVVLWVQRQVDLTGRNGFAAKQLDQTYPVGSQTRRVASGAPRDCDGALRGPDLKRSWQRPDLERSRRHQPRRAGRGVCHAQIDLLRSIVCHDLLRSGRVSQSWGTPRCLGRGALTSPRDFAIIAAVLTHAL